MEQPESFLVLMRAGAGDGGRAIARLWGPDAMKAREVVEAINANPQFFQSPWRGCTLRVERPTTLADVVRRDSDVQECDRWATSFNIIARHCKPERDAVRTLRRAIGAALQRCATATLPTPAPIPNAGMTLRDVGARVRELASVHPWVREGIERSVEDMLVLWDRRRDAEVAREQGTWDGDLPPDPFSLNTVDAPSLPEPERLFVLLYWLGGLADAGVELPLARKPQKTDDTARDVLIHATYEKRTHEPLRPEQAEAWLRRVEGYVQTRGSTEIVSPVAARVPSDHARADESAGPALTMNQSRVLQTMARFDASQLVSADAIEAEMSMGRRLSARTIGPIVRKLIELGLAERPQGDRSGARLTMAGRRLASKIAD